MSWQPHSSTPNQAHSIPFNFHFQISFLSTKLRLKFVKLSITFLRIFLAKCVTCKLPVKSWVPGGTDFSPGDLPAYIRNLGRGGMTQLGLESVLYRNPCPYFVIPLNPPPSGQSTSTPGERFFDNVYLLFRQFVICLIIPDCDHFLQSKTCPNRHLPGIRFAHYLSVKNR